MLKFILVCCVTQVRWLTIFFSIWILNSLDESHVSDPQFNTDVSSDNGYKITTYIPTQWKEETL